jgi:hypothetical protein
MAEVKENTVCPEAIQVQSDLFLFQRSRASKRVIDFHTSNMKIDMYFFFFFFLEFIVFVKMLILCFGCSLKESACKCI